ncbi:MAG: NADPH-dependent 7-cyano-7-deazaguanine reductase QueF [Desulfobacterales bacterium]|nr:NADPH-dependent 7-cyano-7-deazaguanine reductase QueF [Desulfobacterales bacterium]
MKPEYKKNPLGKPVIHPSVYSPDYLFPIPRAESRNKLGIDSNPPFTGADIWNIYEISWLNPKGKPLIAIGNISFPSTTENIIESKSAKLYLNSFSQTKFPSAEAVASAMEKDFSMVANGDVSVSLVLPSQFHLLEFVEPYGVCLDDQDIETDQYRLDPGFLTSGEKKTEERLYSNLLKTNCPVTGQPDWATVIIDYAGRKTDHKGLLRYIISFREHTGFHEDCVERIFTDISKQCNPDKLSVYARFTRRGGIDINPFRSDSGAFFDNHRFARQ